MNQKKKKVLLVQYSQTGQLSRVAQSVFSPLKGSDDVNVDVLNIEPKKKYPFPWGFLEFLDVFPETVYMDAPEIEPLKIDTSIDYDLIVLAYQVWFLSPSLPTTAFLQSEEARNLLVGKPVVTLIACRNMWVTAQSIVSDKLQSLGARLTDNVVFVDQGSSLATFITTPRWMFTGKTNGFWGLPPAGVSDAEIQSASRFGRALLAALQGSQEKLNQPMLSGLKAVSVDYSLVQSEKIGYRSFKIWGKLLRKIGRQGQRRRKPVLVIYSVFLVAMIVTVVPINMILKKLLAPLLKNKHLKEKFSLEQPSGSSGERMEAIIAEEIFEP